MRTSIPPRLSDSPKTPEIAALLAAIRSYLAVVDPPIAASSLSSLLFGSGRQIERLESGCDLTTARLRSAWARLDALKSGGPRKRPSKAAKP